MSAADDMRTLFGAGFQHLFLASHNNAPVSTARQNISGFTPGFEYRLTTRLSARIFNEGGCRVNISLQEDPHGEHSTSFSSRLGIVQPGCTVNAHAGLPSQ